MSPTTGPELGTRIAEAPLTPRANMVLAGMPWQDGDIVTDSYSLISYAYEAAGARWVPYGSTRAPVVLYIDGVNGNDGGDGSVLDPVLTIGEAISRIPPEIRHDVTLDIQDNAGAVFTYDEALVLANKAFYPGARLRFLGKTQLAAPATGPNAIAASVLNNGDWRSFQAVPNPGWTPGDLVGRVVRFTAGPHSGVNTVVLANTVDTLILATRPTGTQGPYGSPLDAFEIRDHTTVVENLTAVLFNPTLTLGNLKLIASYFDPVSFEPSYVRFEDLRFNGDSFLDFTVVSNGMDYTEFLRNTISGYVSWTSGATGGAFRFSFSGLFTNGTPYFIAAPGTGGHVAFASSGMVGSARICNRYDGASYSIAYNGVFIPDPADPTPIFDFQSGLFVIQSNWIDGQLSNIPIRLWPGCFGCLDVQYGNIIENSPYSGIDGDMSSAASRLDGGSGKATILLGRYGILPAGDFVNDIRGNTDYGINLTGMYNLLTYDTSGSTLPNGLGGCRCRWGARIENCAFPGAGPTIAGPLFPIDEIDFDDRLVPWYLLWTDDATGLETLCQIRQNQSLVP